MSNILKYLSKGSLYILGLLEEANYEAYFIGPIVRDALLNKHNTEVTICTNADTDAAYEIFSNNGLLVQNSKYKSNTLFIEKNNTIFEICSYSDDLESYVQTRDFTINGLASDEHGTVIDYVNGLKDIRNKTIRSINNGDIDFCNHPLRMIRAIKYSKLLGFTIEEETKNAIIRNSSNISNMLIDRINQEMKIILEYPFKDTLTDYYDLFKYAYSYDHTLTKKEIGLIDNFPDHSMKMAFFIHSAFKDCDEFVNKLNLSNERTRVIKLYMDNSQSMKLKDYSIDYFKDLFKNNTICDAYKIIQYNCYLNNNDILVIKNKIVTFFDNLIECLNVDITLEEIMDMGFSKAEAKSIFRDVFDNIITGKIEDNRLSIVKTINKAYK